MSESVSPVVEFIRDPHSVFGTTFVLKPSRLNVAFKIHRIISVEERVGGGRPMYETFGCKGSGDWTSDLTMAAPQVNGEVKWDGCAHLWFGNQDEPDGETDGYLHFCEKSHWQWLAWALLEARELCKRILVASGDWLEGEE